MVKVETSAENFQKQLSITNLIDNHIKKIDEDTGGYSSHAHTLRHLSFLELALQRLEAKVLSQQTQMLIEQQQYQWQEHNCLERGNPVKTFNDTLK